MKELTKNLLSDLTTDAEMAFLNDLTDHDAAGVKIEYDKLISAFYEAKLNEITANRQIESAERTMNKQIESHKKYARALNWLTGGLIFVGLVQAAAIIVSLMVRSG